MNSLVSLLQSTDNNQSFKNFDKEWWREFLEATCHLQRTAVIPGAINREELEILNKIVMEVLTGVLLKKTDAYGFRVYVGGERKSGDFLRGSVFPHVPKSGEGISGWAERVFSSKKFGLIINSGEKFSDMLPIKILDWISPLLSILGIPLSGLHSTIFIGNYGYTPLGIHQDHKGANVIHFHLGPGDKIMYNWEEEPFLKLTEGDKQADKNMERLLPEAEKHIFGKGDVYFMPWGKYHIGYAGELSVGLTLWFDNHERKVLMSHILESIKIQYFDMEDETLVPPVSDLSDSSGFSEVEAVLKMEQRHREIPFKDFLKDAFQEYKLALFSNGGWKDLPLSLKDCEEGHNETLSLSGEQCIRSVSPFMIYHRVLNDEVLQVFTRGSKIEIKHHPELINIIDVLNEGGIHQINGLLQKLSDVWPVEVGLYFLSLLMEKRGIEIVS